MSINVTEYLDKFKELQDIPLKELGISFFSAFFIGFFIKKSLKLFLFLSIIGALVLFYLFNKEVSELNNDILLNHSDAIVATAQRIYATLKELFTLLSITNSSTFLIGLILGFKLG